MPLGSHFVNRGVCSLWWSCCLLAHDAITFLSCHALGIVCSGYIGLRFPSKFLQRWWNQLQYLGCIGWLALKADALPNICTDSACQCFVAGLQLGALTCHWVFPKVQQKGSWTERVHRWWSSSGIEWLTTRPNSCKMVSKRLPPTATAARWHQIELLKLAARDGCWGWLLLKGCWGWLLLDGCSSKGSSWGFSFCLLCSSCSVALPHVASPRVDTLSHSLSLPLSVVVKRNCDTVLDVPLQWCVH